MRIDHLKSTMSQCRPISLVTLEQGDENETYLSSEKLKKIISLGYSKVTLEDLSLKPYFETSISPQFWMEHHLGLLPEILDCEYWVCDLEYVDIGIHQRYLPEIIDVQFGRMDDFLRGTCLKSALLPLRVSDLEEHIEPGFTRRSALFQLEPFDWNLHFHVVYSHTSKFASPDPSLIEKIVDILEVPCSQITETECYL